MSLPMSSWPRAAAVGAIFLLLAGCVTTAPIDRTRQEKKRGPLHHYQMARVYFEQGKVSEALAELETSLALDDSLPQTHFYLGYVRSALEEWDLAAEAFRAALERNPYYTEARLYLATCLHESGRDDEALAELDRAAADRTYPDPERVAFVRAVILRDMGRLDEALAQLRRAVGLEPRHYRAHYEMARLLDEMGRGEEALAAFAAAAPGFEDDADFHYRYGATLFRHGRRAEAEAELERAVALAPGSDTAVQATALLSMIR